MKRLRRLARGERGQVLYLTIGMMMVLVTFSVVLINAMYLAVSKVKAQNLADVMALSGATLQARLLNAVTNLNGILFIGVTESGFIKIDSYPTGVQLIAACVTSGLVVTAAGTLITQQSSGMSDRLHAIALANGIDEQKAKIKIHCQEPWQNINYADIKVGKSAMPPYVSPVLPEIEFLNTPWSVQSRVEWQTRDALIGGKYLDVILPDIVARARAEIVDEPVSGLPASIGHDWNVKLAQPDDQIDKDLQGAQPSTSSGSAVPTTSAPTAFSQLPSGGVTHATTNPVSTHTGRTGGNSGVVLPGGTGSGAQGGHHSR